MSNPIVTPLSNARAITFTTQGNNKKIQYTLSNEDYLDLLRAVEYEGEPRDAVAWTLLQRFAFIYPQYETLSKFVRAYAQPINPRWFPTGDKHKEWLDKLVRAKRVEDAEDEMNRARRRVQYAETPLEKISKATRDVVDPIFVGAPNPVPGSVHYRAPTITTKSADEAKAARADFAKKYQLNSVIEYGNPTTQNWFFGQARSLNFRIQALLANAGLGKAVFLLACGASTANLFYQMYVGWRS